MNKNVKLKITDITWNGGNQVKTGTPVVFTVTLKNDGTEDMLPAKQETVIQLHIDTAEPIWCRYDDGLKVGESKTFDFPVWEAVAGNHAITATINFAMPSPTIWESGEVFVKYLRVADQALPVPEFAAAAGMNTLTFSDDFTTLDTVDVKATGEVGYLWYVNRPLGMTTLKPEDYSLSENGIRLHLKDSPHNYGLAMVDARTGAGWGYKHGYMECRFRVDPDRMIEGTHGSPAIWALPALRYWCFIDHWLELDFMEFWGDTMGMGGDLVTVTMHDQIYAHGDSDPMKRWVKNTESYYHGIGDNQWHTMGWLWEEGSLTTYLDGKFLMQQKWGGDDGDPKLQVLKGDLGEKPFTVTDKYTYPFTISGAYGWEMEVDYLNVWQKIRRKVMNSNVKLEITDITWNGGNQVKTGTPVVFTVTLTNNGTEDMQPTIQQTVIQLHINTAEPIWFRYDGGLKVDESKTFDFPVWEAVTGNHTITATVNFANPSPTRWETGEVFVKYLRVADEVLVVPAVAAEAGMNTLTFSDDFTTLDTIDVNATGKVGYHWYLTRPYAMTTLKPTDFMLTEEGIRLQLEEPSHNYGIAMVDSRTGAGWGYKHGYVECRFKVADDRVIPDTKGSPAIWSMPAERYWCFTNHWLEMDYLEYWGTIFSEKKAYTVTMHEQTCEYGSGHGATNWIKNQNTFWHYGLDDNQWHTMGWLWEEGSVTTYLDGKQVMQQKWGGANGEPELHVVNGELGENPFCIFDKYTQPITISGAKGWPMEVDYLNVWQK